MEFVTYHNDGAGGAGTRTTSTLTNSTGWCLLAADFGNSGQTFRNKTTGASVTTAGSNVAYVPEPVNPICLAGAPVSTGFPSGPGNLAFAGIWNRRLSEAEIDAVYANVKAYLAVGSILI